MNIREAAYLWVNRDMSAVPLSVVEKLCAYSDYNDFIEVTPPSINNIVYVYNNEDYGYISDCKTDKDGNSIYTIILDSNKKITITNSSNRVIGFIPYKENFQFDIAAGDVVELTATNVGTVLYYLAQATAGLTVAHEKIEANA